MKFITDIFSHSISNKQTMQGNFNSFADIERKYKSNHLQSVTIKGFLN